MDVAARRAGRGQQLASAPAGVRPRGDVRRAARIVLCAAVQTEVSFSQWPRSFDPSAGLDERHPASLAGEAAVLVGGGAVVGGPSLRFT